MYRFCWPLVICHYLNTARLTKCRTTTTKETVGILRTLLPWKSCTVVLLGPYFNMHAKLGILTFKGILINWKLSREEQQGGSLRLTTWKNFHYLMGDLPMMLYFLFNLMNGSITFLTSYKLFKCLSVRAWRVREQCYEFTFSKYRYPTTPYEDDNPVLRAVVCGTIS